MLPPTTRELVDGLLRLFTCASGVPVQLFEKDDSGYPVSTISHDDEFPAHCKAIWKLNGGRARCVDNMCHRVAATFRTGNSDEAMCHAGLDTARYPLRLDGETVAVIQYGAFAMNDGPEKHAERFARHRSAMESLQASPEEARDIERLLKDRESTSPAPQWHSTRGSLPPIIEQIVTRYLTERSRQRKFERDIYHDLLLRLTAAVHAADALIDGEPTGSHVRVKTERVVSAIYFARNVAYNLWRGEYLPEKYDFRQTPLTEVIAEARHLCAPEAESRGLTFNVDLQGDCTVALSRVHLQSAMNNLIHNAVKYSYRTTDKSGARYVSIRGTAQSSGYEIVITNYGVGFERDEYERIFQPGYRGRHTRAEYRSGAGQGLALAKVVIERHAGRISLASQIVTAGPYRPGDQPSPYVTRCVVWLPYRQRLEPRVQ